MKTKKIIAPYIGDKGIEFIRKEDIQRASWFFYAFTSFKDGIVSTDAYKNLEKIKAFKEVNPDLKLIFSIGGWGQGGFSTAAATKEGRALFVETSIGIVKGNDFDGVDIDWEYPTIADAGIDADPGDKETYTLLLQDLREGLDELSKLTGKQYLLTTAVGANQAFIDGTEMDKAVAYLDYVNLMTYDMRGFLQTTGHHTNLYPQQGKDHPSAQATIELFHKAGVPYEKMILGAAFYGRKWEKVHNDNDPTGLNCPAETTGANFVRYPEIKECLENGVFTRHWDDAAKAPYAFDSVNNAFICYDDEESLAHKCEYVQSSQLAGIMFWQYDNDTTYTLIEAIFQNMGF